jgi:hypothetical protein
MRLAAVVVALIVAGAPALAQSTAAKNDYSKPETWLCRPGLRDDACAVDLTTTVVTAEGRLTREPFTADPKAPIDCFYVYPTISMDPGANSDMTIGVEERRVIQAQFARFASVCRPFAPLYRQVTLTALRAATAGKPMAADRALAYNDVADAWRHYLQHDNGGRGVVLVGHSQGSGVLTQLIRDEIDGKPVQKQLVSALLLGTNVAVPRGKDLGGSFTQVPLCRSTSQTGCVIGYVSFRSTIPPPADSRFGRVAGEGMEAACTNPAALGGGKGALHAYLSATSNSIVNSSQQPTEWVTPPESISTPFVSVPGLLSAQCVSTEKGSYLEITVHADPHDRRTDDIAGDVVVAGKVVPSWGLHLIEVHAAFGNLIEVVRAQTKSYLGKGSR